MKREKLSQHLWEKETRMSELKFANGSSIKFPTKVEGKRSNIIFEYFVPEE